MPQKADLGTAEGMDLSRLERGVHLQAMPLGKGRYEVVGGEHPHLVDLHYGGRPHCDCPDFRFRAVACKHILAALLHEGDTDAIHALSELVRSLRHLAEEEEEKS